MRLLAFALLLALPAHAQELPPAPVPPEGTPTYTQVYEIWPATCINAAGTEYPCWTARLTRRDTCIGDIDGDGTVGGSDFGILQRTFLTVCEGME